MASALEVDIEILISLVEARPVLWDKTLEIYKDKNETRKAWIEVCVELNGDFEALEHTEKNKFAKDVLKKWGNIRDAFTKSRKKQKKVSKSGASILNIKKYIYNEQLQFLNKVIQERPTHDSLSVDAETSQTKEVKSKEENFRERTEQSNDDGKFTKPRKELSSRKRKLDEVEIKMLQVLEERPDRYMSFFKGILPSLQSFNEDEDLQFQIGVLQLIMNIKQQKRMSAPYQPKTAMFHQQSPYQQPGTIFHEQFQYQNVASQRTSPSQQMLLTPSQFNRNHPLHQSSITQPPLSSPASTPSPALSINSSTMDSLDFSVL